MLGRIPGSDKTEAKLQTKLTAQILIIILFLRNRSGAAIGVYSAVL